ncbi:hypothetical protein E34_1540 [Lactococcus lactis subsp. lactis]|uniref:hypothetical protein n=1 Tax=Lactococcus lactis TaxID=1358 RepID=UPI00071D7CE6|nr:hypothetical protein [Lactococcus lactis]KST78017.1 hypothetical protein E34_1540 [Lactococcus lactis subsp. lactis]
MASLKCPKCKSGNIQLWSNNNNLKTKKTTSLNLNPLKPFTVFNHKEKAVKKNSKGKVVAALITGGTSLLITGTKDNKGKELHCNNCGNLWKSK